MAFKKGSQTFSYWLNCLLYLILNVWVFCLPVCCVCVCLVHLVTAEARKGHWMPGNRVIGSYELPCRCWDSSRSSLWGASALNYWSISLTPSSCFLKQNGTLKMNISDLAFFNWQDMSHTPAFTTTVISSHITICLKGSVFNVYGIWILATLKISVNQTCK